MAGDSSPMTIGRLAKRAGVGIDTIRFYERRGILPEPRRTASGYRLYRDDAVARIRFIRRAKELGFSLDEISLLLRLQDVGGPKAEVKQLTDRKIHTIDSKIQDLARMKHVLERLSGSCSGQGDVAGCPIIEALFSDEELEDL